MGDLKRPGGGGSNTPSDGLDIIRQVEDELRQMHGLGVSVPSSEIDCFAEVDSSILKQRFDDLIVAMQSDPAMDKVLDPLADISSDWSSDVVAVQSMSVSRHAESFSPEQSPSIHVVEIHGYIKWFDASKGYGFIVPDNGLPDVLLHVTHLRAAGFQTALEGARIGVEIVFQERGLSARRVVHMDETTAIRPSDLPQRTHVFVEAESGWERAKVKWFNKLRGFGFLSRGEGTTDIFVHMETLRRFGFVELQPGQDVLVRWGHGSKGVMAAELRPVGAQIPPRLDN